MTFTQISSVVAWLFLLAAVISSIVGGFVVAEADVTDRLGILANVALMAGSFVVSGSLIGTISEISTSLREILANRETKD